MNKLINVRTKAIKVGRLVGYTAYFFCVGHCVLEYIGDFVVCVGPSMEPTIYSKDVVITEHLSINQHKVNRGDIVITKSPYNPKQNICKRVKAIPGDKIRYGFFSEIVPKGHIWLEGDNKENSCDSRSYGPVPQGLLKGRVILIIWPFNNVRKLTKFAQQST